MSHYLLLTPGPLTTSESVKQAMLKDWCTWDEDYNQGVVEVIREKLVALATSRPGYTSVLMQGSGTASVESVIGSALGRKDKLLVINNGAYGARIGEIADYLNIPCVEYQLNEVDLPKSEELDSLLQANPSVTHVALVHCETTTGMLNPIDDLAKVVKKHKKVLILDAMSSFGGIEMDIAKLDVDFMISSANKCIQGVPGFGFVIAKEASLAKCAGQARSLSLDLYAQWKTMEQGKGKWRFTSPTHVVRAFAQALTELEDEGGIKARAARYKESQQTLVSGMIRLGFEPLLPSSEHSPIITSFYSPTHEDYDFKRFYQALKAKGFVIYPGKVSNADCFRIGNIGQVNKQDIERLLDAIKTSRYWMS